ncbi:MAG TPA: hypothetical protein VEK57_16210 [Thermoanaerobaculia bacterium]|nr:hypothetical protein [Thermoanaerobaculia bacterium]
MPHRDQRITLIARDATKPSIDWNYGSCMRDRIAFLDSIEAIRLALGAALDDVGLDIGRIIIDRGADAAQFLSLLAETPVVFGGDILMVCEDGNGFLSASGRGGDRKLYALARHDIRFYFETHNLVTGRVMLEKSA